MHARARFPAPDQDEPWGSIQEQVSSWHEAAQPGQGGGGDGPLGRPLSRPPRTPRTSCARPASVTRGSRSSCASAPRAGRCWAEAPVERRIGAPGRAEPRDTLSTDARPIAARRCARQDTRPARACCCVAAAFRLPGLGYPGEEYFDEVYHAKTALQYLNGEPPTEWVHPPTAKLLIAVGVCALRLPPLGLAARAGARRDAARRGLPAARAARAAERARRRPRDGAAAVRRGLPGAEPDRDDQRVRGAVPAARRAARCCARPARGGWAPAHGRGRRRRSGSRSRRAGRACSPWGFLGLVFLALRARAARARPRRVRTPRRSAPLAREAALVVARLRADPPAAVYLLSYLPWMAQAHPPAARMGAARARRRAHCSARSGATTRTCGRPTPTSAPGGPGRSSTGPPGTSGGRASGAVRGIVALGNPAIWWAAVPAAAWALVTGLRARDPRTRLHRAPASSCSTCRGGSRRARSTSATTCSRRSPTPASPWGWLLDRAWDGRRRAASPAATSRRDRGPLPASSCRSSRRCR